MPSGHSERALTERVERENESLSLRQQKEHPIRVLFLLHGMERDSKGAGVNGAPVALQSCAPTKPAGATESLSLRQQKEHPIWVLFLLHGMRRDSNERVVNECPVGIQSAP